jgi:plasmid replication initiation protein
MAANEATGMRYVEERIEALSGKSRRRRPQTASTSGTDDAREPAMAEFVDTGPEEEAQSVRAVRRRGRSRLEQLDFFPVQLVDAALKGDWSSMEHPFFSISKNRDTRIRHYEHNGNSVTITPSVSGMATIWDKDVLLYAVSALSDAINQGRPTSRTIRLHPYDLLRYTGRDTGKRAYDLLDAALARLRGTVIRTDITTGGVRRRHNFGLIESSRIVTLPNGKRGAIEITLSEWLYGAIVESEVLTMNRDYFKLTSGLERRCYEVARKHVGKQPKWVIGLETLYKKSGSRSSLKEFARQMRELVARNGLPDYVVAYDEPRKLFTFRPRPRTALAVVAGDPLIPDVVERRQAS